MNTTAPRFLMTTAASSAIARDRTVTAEDLQLEPRARSLWKQVTGPFMGAIGKSKIRWIAYRLRREDKRSDPLELLTQLVVGFFNLGLPEATLRRIPQHLDGVIDDCFVGKAGRTIGELDRLEFEEEHVENGLALERQLAHGNVTAEQLDAEADAIDAEIAISREKARTLRRFARRQRSGVAVTTG